MNKSILENKYLNTRRGLLRSTGAGVLTLFGLSNSNASAQDFDFDKSKDFDDDQLFAVNPTDFSLTTISNRNLEGKNITSAIVYNHKVWLTTLDGLFTRNIENF